MALHTLRGCCWRGEEERKKGESESEEFLMQVKRKRRGEGGKQCWVGGSMEDYDDRVTIVVVK